MATLYDTIEALCRLNEVNITMMCRDTGISRASMTDLKKGRSQTLTAETLEKIARYFRVTIDFLMDPEDDKFDLMGGGGKGRYAQKEKPATSSDGSDMDLLLSRCTEEQREMIKKLVSLPPEKLSALLKLTEPFLSEE